MPEGNPRVWLLTNTPSPYQLDLFRAIDRTGDVQLSVRFLNDTHRGERPLKNSLLSDVRVLTPSSSTRLPGSLHRYPGACEEISSGVHDLYVLSGTYSNRAFIACARLLHRLRKPWAVWLESPWPENLRPPWATRMSARFPVLLPVRRLALRYLTTNATMVWAIGTAAMKAYTELGANPDKLHLLPYAADTSRFKTSDGSDVRERLGLAGKMVFLFSGSLVPRKGIDVLLDAYTRFHKAHPDSALLVLGDGPLRGMVEQHAAAAQGVVALGHRGQEELPAYFHAADVFVFPSRYDGWGVVLQEACAAGLPVITTDQAGAALDLVRQGINGTLIHVDDPEALSDAMTAMARDPARRAAMGRASREVEERFGIEAGAQRFLQGVERCLEKGKAS